MPETKDPKRNASGLRDELKRLANAGSAYAPHGMDAAELEKTRETLEWNEMALAAISKAAIALLGRKEESFAEAMAEGIGLIAGIAGIDKVSVFLNSRKPGGLCLSQLYRWKKEAGGAVETRKNLANIPYARSLPRWEGVLAAGKRISGLARLMPEAGILQRFGCVSILAVPAFNDGQFWGFVLFEKLKEENFSGREIDALSAAGFMLANAVIRDKEAARMRQAVEQAKLMLDATPFCCAFWDSKHKIIYCNDAAAAIFKLENKTELPARFLDCCPEYQPDGQKSTEKLARALNKAFDDGYCVFSCMHQTVDGTPIPAEITFVRVKYQDAYAVAGYMRDLREHNRMTLEIERQNELLRTVNNVSAIILQTNTENFESNLLHSMGILAKAADADRVYIWKNRARDGSLYCSQIYEWSEGADPQQGKDFTVETSYGNLINWQETFLQRRGINSVVRELPAEDRGLLASQGIQSILVEPIFLKNEFWGFMGFDDCRKERLFTKNEEMILRSASELIAAALVRNDMEENIRASADKLQNALTEAQAASRAKSEFLSRMSHEMRTPMNAIIGMTNIAKGTDDAEKKDYCLGKIDRASSHLLGVINDVLDMSKIEANKLELAPHVFNFEDMLINVTDALNFRVDEKNQNLIVHLDEHIPPCVIGDELRLTQIITNLLTNAVKFTPEGGSITLNAKCLEDDDTCSNLLIEVIDTGIGISEEQQSRLFTAFEQAEGGTARKYGGTGLGLAISKRIVELMGGDIWIESKLGGGAKFAFMVTLRKSGEQAPLPRIDGDDVEILAVDDSPEIREYFTSVMGRFGFNCDVAADGEEALDMIRLKKSRPYNIFFVDWIMPGMDGIELAGKIKEINRDNSIIIMISSAEWNKIAEEGKKAGIDRFISKPLFPSALVKLIESCMGKGELAPEETGKETSVRYEGRNILVAEDVEINREIVSAILEDSGLNIDFANNGREALGMFESDPGKYSMILMDLQMPEMDGYDATRGIRALPCREAGRVPIIAMTANVFKEDVASCLAAGMDDHIGKPIDTAALFRKLRQHLQKPAGLPLSARKENSPPT